MSRTYQVGDRIRIFGYWEFPDGITGSVAIPTRFQLTLANPGEWEGHRRTVPGRKGPIVFYFIQFDVPTDDGSGDGSYGGAEIEEDCLVPFVPDA